MAEDEELDNQQQGASRRGKRDRNKALTSAQRLFQTQLQLHAQAEEQHHISVEREKLLCDQVLHQQFLCELFVTQGRWELLPLSQVPCSYVAQLLQQPENVQARLQQVLRLSPAGWLSYFANLFGKVVCLLELCHRSDQHGTPLAPAGQQLLAGQQLQDSGPAQQAAMHGPGPQRPQAPLALPDPDSRLQLHTSAGPLQADASCGCATVGAAPPNLLAHWFRGQPPLGQDPAADYAQLQELVAGVAADVMLAYVFNHVPLLEACSYSYSPGPHVRPTAQHWETVADRLHLTELQELHMSLCLDELRRLNSGSRADGGVLLQRAATPTLLVASLQKQQQDSINRAATQAPPHDPASGVATAGAAAAGGGGRGTRRSSRHSYTPAQRWQEEQEEEEEEREQSPQLQDAGEGGILDDLLGSCGQDQLQQRLQHWVQRRHVHLLSAATYFMNLLSPYQLALLISHSYPWLPSFTGVAEVVARRRQARQEAHLRSVIDAATAAAGTQRNGPAGGSRGGSPEGGGGPLAAGGHRGGSSAGSGGSSSGFLLGTIKQHEQRRVQELELHRQLCWSEVNATQQQQQQMGSS